MSQETTQHIVVFSERKNHISDYMLDEIRPFFEEIDHLSEQYEYITAAERRAFNLAAWHLTDISRLVSNSGMLLQYKKLAECYRRQGRFPKILLIDDLMMHGRGMSKFLDQLETLVQDELGYNTWNDYDQMNCRRRFADSIDIFVYAKNKLPVLLDSRFTWQVHARKKLYLSEMRDLSLQLSDFLSRKNIANTSFVPAFLCQDLSTFLEKRTRSGVSDYDVSSEKLNMKWFGIRWRYLDEDMLLFLSFRGQKYTNRISTIRFFPSRGENSNQVISFSILPKLPKLQFDELCKQVDNVLLQYELKYLSSILRKEEPILQQNKGQLLDYIISVIDYLDFQCAIKEQQKKQNESDKIRFIVDVGKIASTFGLQADSKHELIDLISKTVLRQKLNDVFCSVLDQTAAENALLNFVPTDPQTVFQSDDFRKYNHEIETIIYDCGAESEKKALDMLQHSYDFVPSEYQNYSISSQSHDCCDGILSLHDMIEKVGLIEPKNGDIQSSVVPSLCAYIALMDNGILSTRLQFTEGKEQQLVTILKAGELSTFSVPREISVFIPAFAKVSYYGSRLGLTQKEAVSSFYRKYYASVNGAPIEYKDACRSLFAGMCEAGYCVPSPKKIEEMTDMIYNCGQSYGSWNFRNMTYQSDDKCREFQETLLDEADLFVSRSAKYWE